MSLNLKDVLSYQIVERGDFPAKLNPVKMRADLRQLDPS